MKKTGIIIIVAAFFLNGCLLTSFNSLYKQSDLITNDALLGKWIGKKALLSFERQDGLGYLLNYKDCEDPYNAPEDYSTCTVADFTAHLMKLGDEYYLDFYPRSYLNTDNLFLNLHIRPTHSFAKVLIEKDTLKILQIDYAWIVNYLENNKDKLDNIKSDDLITLTATTEELQAFVLKHHKEAGFFSEPVVVTRKK